MYVRSGIKIAHIHMPIRTQTTHNNQNKTKQKKMQKINYLIRREDVKTKLSHLKCDEDQHPIILLISFESVCFTPR